ncbi:MAG: Gfo/Idh/MocA family oxidoreductase [Spirochaetales bacterium]|jgi:predicted dehydrogenase|nr:Gfo/Idh/MocA family oxidoreductase [Spirochaetales bacterium]
MNFGIIGTGMISAFHYRAISEIPGCRVVACMDSVAERARVFGVEHNCAGYGDLGKFLAHPGLDVVTVCTPSGTHLEAALAVAGAGKHLIIEKPVEVTLARIDKIIEACDKSGVSLSGVFMSRYYESSRALKLALEAGRFGQMVLGSAYIKWWRAQEYYDRGGWRGTWEFDGGGALMNQGIHAVDLLQWFMGPVESVFSYAGLLGHEGIEVEDTAVACLRFRSGAFGVIEGSTAAYPGSPKRLEISGVRGSAVLEEESIKGWNFADELPGDAGLREKLGARPGSGGSADPSAISYHGHRAQFTEIVEALASGRKPAVDGLEARKAVEIILAIYRSAQTGGEVKLPL